MLPFVVTTILERGERFREIFDVVALFALPPHDANLDHISALVQAEQAPDRDVTMNVRRDDLEGEVERVRLLERVPFLLVILVIPRNFVSFETATDLILRYPWLFLGNLKTYEAWC
jgi:hypothetical protein